MASSEELPSADVIFAKVTSSMKMDRDSGLAALSRLVKAENCDEKEKKYILQQIREQVATALIELGNREMVSEGKCTDKKQGSLSAALIMLSGSSEDEDIGQFILTIKTHVLQLLWDHDIRVRLIAGELYGIICKILGPSAYLDAKSALVELLESEFARSREVEGAIKSPETPIDPTGEVASSEPHFSLSPQLGASPITTPVNPNVALSEVLKQAVMALQSGTSPGVGMAYDINFGSVQLESSLKCVQFIAKGLENQFGKLVDQHLLDLIYPALSHQNRFVRETGFFLCATIIESDVDLKAVGRKMCEEISRGLSDICSQSRIASAIACRKFMMSLQKRDREEYYPCMLPRLCLSRYYMADAKFLLYSQESWRTIFGTDGPQLVSQYIDDVVTYYIEATASDNHAIREAACACLGELSRKIDKSVVLPYAPQILETLRRCFMDERWHVRDAACLASGNLIVNYPEECKAHLDSLYPLFFENLEFPISIVRQGAAAALANTVRAYGKAAIPRLIEKISNGLNEIEKQPPETCTNADTPFGINPEVKYSYPPGQGAHFLPYARPSQPWEVCDGCMYLIGDLAQIPECQSELPTLIPMIIKANEFRSYSQHVVVLETTCKILPWLVKGIGKKPFKEYLSQFFETIFYSIECDNSLTSAAAKSCLQELAQIYGPNIIRSRIELHDPRFVNFVEST